MSSCKCAEKFCKECLSKIPEEEREAIFQNPGKFIQALVKGFESWCQGNFICGNMKEK